jgi:RNA-binding protein
VWTKEKIPDSEGTAFEKRKLRRLQARSRTTDPTIWIGKDGASEELLKQVENQLKTRELVKVKIHKSALALAEVETSGFAEKIAASTSSDLVEIMGHTFTLYKRREIPRAERKR